MYTKSKQDPNTSQNTQKILKAYLGLVCVPQKLKKNLSKLLLICFNCVNETREVKVIHWSSSQCQPGRFRPNTTPTLDWCHFCTRGKITDGRHIPRPRKHFSASPPPPPFFLPPDVPNRCSKTEKNRVR